MFTFNGTTGSSHTSSFATLVSDVNLPDTFILCSSSKQARFDDVGFLSISGKHSGEWLVVEFVTFTEATKLVLRWDGSFHILGTIENPKLDYWYHVCLGIDLTKKEIVVSVNGLVMGILLDQNVTNSPSKLEMKMGTGHQNQQFSGSVANIRLFREGNITDLSSEPCKLTQSAFLPWDHNNWNVVGVEWSLTEEYEDIFCVPRDHYNLAIPSRMTINESMDICKHKLNNSIIPFHQDPETLLKYMAWHKKATGASCPWIWTPLSDQTLEGVFVNMNNNAEVKLQDQVWAKSEPNGGKDENFVIIDTPRGALIDVIQTKLSCSSCLLSSSLQLQLDGLCEDSLIGEIKMIEIYKSCLQFQTRSTRS